MFHVKRFGTIGSPKCTKSAYVLWLEARGITQNNCKFGARSIAAQVCYFVCAYRPGHEFGFTGAAGHMADKHVAIKDIEALTEIYGAIMDDYFVD
jgi:hypothetical protein